MSVGYVELLRKNRNYRLLWLSEVISFLGDWFNTIALYAVVEQLSDSAEAITAVFVAKMLPMFLMTPVAGPLIDRFDRRKLLIASDVARAAGALGLIGAYWLGSLWLLLLVLIVMVACSGVFIPARSAVFPQLIEPLELGAANALSAATWSSMLALGAALGGAVTALVGIEVALVIDAATFLLSAAFLYPLPPLLPTAEQAVGTGKNDRGFFDGLRYLKRHPYLAAIISIKPAMAITGAGLALLPIFASRVYGGGSMYLGVLYAARGVGALIGSLGIRKIFGDAPTTMRRSIAPGFFVVGVAYIAFSRAPSVWLAAVALALGTVGGSALWVFSGTLGQLESANEYRGRVFAIEMGGLTLMMAVTGGGAGSFVDRFAADPRQIVFYAGVAMALPLLLWLGVLSLTRSR